ncbi:MAG TPA: DUF3037 domain-containing protein [Candidatus Acidoferrum sp.]|jgi:hypothetical protein
MNHQPFNTNQNVAPEESACVYRVLRYTPNLVRDEWVNIGILLFNPYTGERRLRIIEEEDEYRRVRRLHPRADEELLRGLSEDLEDRFQIATSPSGNGSGDWQQTLAKLDESLSNALQLAPQKGVVSTDIDTEMERLYADHVTPPQVSTNVGAPSSRARMRSYCSQVFRQARLWERLEKSVRAELWTLPGDPLRIDYSYRHNGTLGFVHTLSVTRSPNDFKQLAYTAERIRAKEKLKTEFAAVTDVPLVAGDKRDDFVAASLREVGIEPVPMEGFAVWVAKLKPLLLQ